MKHDKVLHIRVPAELHDYLTRYAAANFTSVSSVVLQVVAKAVGYKPKMATSRVESDPTPKPVKLMPDPIVGGEWMDVDE